MSHHITVSYGFGNHSRELPELRRNLASWQKLESRGQTTRGQSRIKALSRTIEELEAEQNSHERK